MMGQIIVQQEMIERVRALCRQDDAVRAAMMYGSFALGEGDAYSDIEFLFFIRDGDLTALDQRIWLEQIAPTELVFVNEFGVTTALFTNLIRGEFHFDPVSRMEEMAAAWLGTVWFPSLEATLLVDKDNRLAPLLEPIIGEPLRHGQSVKEVQTVLDRFLNGWLMGWTVLRRGEAARALEVLAMTQRYLLMMVRIVAGTTVHWYTPSRALEHDISPEAYARYRRCTSALDVDDLGRAYAESWGWFVDLLPTLGRRPGVTASATLIREIDSRVSTSRRNETR
jgi:lincosamide nucleotidyltransferase B/F